MMALLMGVPSISPKELDRMVREGGAAVMDVNSPERWREGHVPGARNLDPELFGTADLPADRSALLVFYCSNPLCRKAPSAALRARKLGYDNVRVMSAGIKGWRGAGLAVEAGVGRS